MALTIGSHADVIMHNAAIESANQDGTWVLIRLPDSAAGILEYWVPSGDPRVSVNPIVPANWPPIDGDLWTVPGVTPTAWVVTGPDNVLYFVTEDAIRNVYGGDTAPPVTIDQAIALYGNALTLLYRQGA